MDIMDKEFVPYEEALALKELGFNQYSCLGNYADDEKHTLFTNGNRPGKTNTPTFSQAFRWFRDNHDCHHSITRLPQKALDVDVKNNKLLKKYAWFISKDDLNPTIPNNGSGKCDTYEEAELACLRKLIEIVSKWGVK